MDFVTLAESSEQIYVQWLNWTNIKYILVYVVNNNNDNNN